METPNKQSVYIEFPATVIDHTDVSGENNTADVTCIESCCGVTRHGHDEATIIVEGPPEEPDINIVKKVKRPVGVWGDSVTVDVGDVVMFKITVTNTGNVDLTDVLVFDNLPDFLVYNDDAVPSDDSSSDHYIEWMIGTLTVEDIQVITFTADAIEIGECDNVANVTTLQGVSDEDYAHVIVEEISEPLMIFEKKVWNETSDQWEESIQLKLVILYGSILRFHIMGIMFSTI